MTSRLGGMLAVFGIALLLVVVIYLEGRARGASIEKHKTDVALAAAEDAKSKAELARRAAVRVDGLARRTAESAALTREYALAATKAEDANAPLSEARIARLADADQRMCGLNGQLEGCAAVVSGP